MLTRFSIKVAALLASVLFLAAPMAFGDITANPTTREGLKEYKLKFTSSDAINSISEPIRACSNMTVFWELSNTTQVTAYPADSNDDTVAEIEANAALATFTSTTKEAITSDKAYVRFVVDAVTVGSTPSTAVVVCSEYARSGGAGIPGLAGTVGNDETLAYLFALDEIAALSPQVAASVYVDPYYGNDTTGTGTYTNPYFSFAKIKAECLTIPHSKCVVKGRDRVFTHTLLTLDYSAAAGTRHLMPGEVVTFSTPAGTAEVLAVEGNYAAVTWISGADPRVNGVTTFTAGTDESQGTVTAVRDSINGLPTRVIAATDITTATNVIAGTAGTGHSYTSSTTAAPVGPFKWYNQTTMPTASANPITEYSTTVYICTVVAGVSFQVSTDPNCANIVDFSSQGTGSNQIIAGGDADASVRGLRSAIDLPCNDNDRVCVLFTSEYPDSPWRIDSGALPGDGAFYVETNTQRWSTGPSYNTATGGLFLVDAASNDPTATGWLAVQNGIISNLADDCFSTGSGGKLLALNVRCNIRNGVGDRGQNGGTPGEQASNSVASAYGTNTVDGTAAASALIVIDADGSTSQMGSPDGSGGFLNPNDYGVMRFLSPGVMDYDGISGDTTCTTPCSSPFMVQPGGDSLVVGPHLKIGGNGLASTLVYTTGSEARTVYAKTVVEGRGVKATASSNSDTPFINIAGGGQGVTKVVSAYNVTFKASGPQNFFTLCPLTGTSAATATSRLVFTIENSLFEGISSAAASYRANVSDCGTGGYTDGDAVARATVRIRGVWDIDEDNPGCSGPCWFYNISSTSLPTFLTTVRTATDSAGNVAGTAGWEIFDVSSGDSGGLGVDGLSWRSGDNQFRCIAGEECFGSTYVSAPTYTLDLKDYYGGTDVSCIPEDVVGTKICSLKLSSVNAGAR